MKVAMQCLTHFSIGEAFAKPVELVKRAHELKLDGIAITDLHSLAGCVEFYQEIVKQNKKSEHKVKPIFGMTVDVAIPDKADYQRYVLWAKNYKGWKSLIKLTSSVQLDNKHRKFISYQDFAPELENLIVLLQDSIVPIYYAHPDDKLYHQIMLCVKLKKTLDEAQSIDGPYAHFFHEANNYSVYASDDDNINQIEEFSILQKPIIPKFTVDSEFKDSNDMLYQLCRKGWIDKELNLKTQNDSKLKQIYVDRIKEELNVFISNGLADYMLIIRDFIQFCRKHKQHCGLRGSSVGCLVAYLIDISNIDPLQPDPTLPYAEERELMFSRFFNAARKDSLPDCDLDIPMSFRPKLISHIENKYGKDKLAHIITFSRMDGKGALKEVFRILNPVANSFAVANEITANMIDTAKVQDILEDYKEDNPDYSIIDYCIEHVNTIAEYAKEFPREFEIAKKLTSTIRASGIHAAGIVICNQPLSEMFPVDYSRDGTKLVALEMADLEAVGGCKYDILSVAAYEKIGVVEHMIRENLDEVPLPEEGVLDEASV